MEKNKKSTHLSHLVLNKKLRLSSILLHMLNSAVGNGFS